MPYIIIALAGGIAGMLTMRGCEKITERQTIISPTSPFTQVIPIALFGLIFVLFYIIIKQGGLK